MFKKNGTIKELKHVLSILLTQTLTTGKIKIKPKVNTYLKLIKKQIVKKSLY